MSEFIREVDEDYRQDQIRSLIGRYWIWLLAIAILVLVGVGGWRGYEHYRQQRDEAAGSRYFEATQTLAGDRTASLAALDGLAAAGPAGYRLLARFKAASELAQTDGASGVKAYDALAADPSLDSNVRDIAKLRAALLTMDAGAPDELGRRLEPLADADAPFRNVAREMLALAALRRGEDASAKRWLEAEQSDPVASQDQRQRAGWFLGLIRSGPPGEAPAPAVSADPAGAAAPTPASAPEPAPAPPSTAAPDPKPSEPPPPGADPTPTSVPEPAPASPSTAAPSPNPSEPTPPGADPTPTSVPEPAPASPSTGAPSPNPSEPTPPGADPTPAKP